MCAQELRTEVHGGFAHAENAVHGEAVATREAVGTVVRAEAEATRKTVQSATLTETEVTREAVHAIVHVEAETTRQVVAQVRCTHSLPIPWKRANNACDRWPTVVSDTFLY